MTYLIDTDWAADWLAERRAARDLLTGLQPAGLFFSLLSYGELYEGIYFGKDPPLMEQRFHDFLRGVSLVGFDEDTMRTYARIRGTLRSQGNLIGEGDLLIAAAAIRNGLTLVTRNLRDFQRITGLRLYGTS